MSDIITVEVTEVVDAVTAAITEAPVTVGVTVAEAGVKGDTGPAGPAVPAGVDKAIQFRDGDVTGGSSNFRYDKNTGSVIVGFPDLLTNNPLAIGGALNDFLQVTVQNTTEGDAASSDFVATADNGDDDNHYVDLGINSSVYAQEDYDATSANDSYLINKGGDLVIAAGTAGKKVKIAAGGTRQANIVATFGESGLELPNRPPIYYGTGSPPDPSGLPDGTLFFKYTE